MRGAMTIRHPLFWPSVLSLVLGPTLAISAFAVVASAHLMKSGARMAPETDAFARVLLICGIVLFVIGILAYFVQKILFNSASYPGKYVSGTKSQEKLARICARCDDPRFYHAALPLLTDDAIRFEYAKIAAWAERAKALLNNIRSPEIRYRAVMSFALEVCEDLLPEITDIPRLKEIAAKATDNKVKRWASNRVLFTEDPVRFFSSEYPLLKEKEKYAHELKDEELCFKVLLLVGSRLKVGYDTLEISRILLPKMVTASIIEKELLRAENANILDDCTIRELLKKISSDPKSVRNFINNARSEHVRDAALGLVNDEDALMDIHLHHAYAETRRDAACKIKEQSKLWAIVQNCDDAEVLRYAVARIEVSGEEQRIFMENLATNHKDDGVRAVAVEKITNQKLLADIARTDGSREVRIHAIHLLEDEKLRERLMKVESRTADIKPGRYTISGSGNITIIHRDGSRDRYAVHNAANDYGYSSSEEVSICMGDIVENYSSVDWKRLGD